MTRLRDDLRMIGLCILLVMLCVVAIVVLAMMSSNYLDHGKFILMNARPATGYYVPIDRHDFNSPQI
jgi:hypothetical protein